VLRSLNFEVVPLHGGIPSEIALQSLAPVNYFVGQNSSGKSLILKKLFQTYYENSLFVVDALSNVDNKVLFSGLPLTPSLYCDLKNRHYTILDLLTHQLRAYEHDQPSGCLQNYHSIRAQTETFLEALNLPTTNILDTSSGYKKLFNIAFALFEAMEEHPKLEFVLVEEPETHLYPTIQKLLPHMFALFAQRYNLQFFVVTNSPFVLSSVGTITEEEIREQQYAQQKVYFLKNYQLADKYGRPSSVGRSGYWGSKINFIASKMLGAGLSDLFSNQLPVTTSTAGTVIFCEGEGINEDAKLYNIIFKDVDPPVLFISCRGLSQAEKSFDLISQVRSGLSANFKLLLLRDRDEAFPDDQALEQYKQQHPGHRVLRHRAIECYLYNSETARLLLQQFGKELPSSGKQKLDRLHATIENQAQEGVPGDAYKFELSSTFNSITSHIGVAQYGELLPQHLAALITPQTKTYQELERVIFG
jgi:hypothetical protein